MRYRDTIARQPQQFAESLPLITQQIEDFDLTAFKQGIPFGQGTLAFVGIGASYEAAVVSAAEWQRHGRRATAWHAVDLLEAKNPADSFIALSSGGRSVEPVNALRQHPTLPSLAVTSEGNTPLDDVANASLAFYCGEDATPSSVGYTTMLLATGLLTDALMGEKNAHQWQDIAPMAEELLAQSEAKMSRIGEIFANRRAIDCVGANGSLGSAGEAGLLIREAARIPTGCFDTLHYLHGPMEPMDKTTAVIIFGDGREIKLAQDLANIGCGVLLITTNREVSEQDNLAIIPVPACDSLIKRGLLEILPAQLLAAQLSDAAGLTDTKFRYPQDDTKIK